MIYFLIIPVAIATAAVVLLALWLEYRSYSPNVKRDNVKFKSNENEQTKTN
jgi:hypothetical protein